MAKSSPTLPAAPLLAALQRLCGADAGVERLARRAGVPERTIRRWRNDGESPLVATADRVLCASGLLWWDVWPVHPTAIAYFGDHELCDDANRRAA